MWLLNIGDVSDHFTLLVPAIKHMQDYGVSELPDCKYFKYLKPWRDDPSPNESPFTFNFGSNSISGWERRLKWVVQNQNCICDVNTSDFWGWKIFGGFVVGTSNFLTQIKKIHETFLSYFLLCLFNNNREHGQEEHFTKPNWCLDQH